MSSLRTIALLLLGSSPTTLLAGQVAAPSGDSQAPEEGPAQDGALTDRSPQLPPNVSITTPDGKPLAPEMLKKVLEILKNDPAVQALSRAPERSSIRKVVGDTEIVVTGKRLRGTVVGNVEPTRIFNPIDIRAYGAATVSELIGALGDEVTSDRESATGRPIVLLNGRRISNFEEIALYPTEAIERMEVFPEALALQYGFTADQKVVNLVTFKFFSQESVQTGARRTTSGGGGQENAGFQMLRIIDEKRYSLAASLERSTGILESQRDINQPGSAEGQAPFRSLQPETLGLTISGSFSGLLTDRATFTVRGSGGFDRVEALLGSGANGIVSQVVDSYTKTLGVAVNGQLGRWRWSSTSSFRSDRSKNRIRTGETAVSENPARSKVDQYATDASLIGSLFRVPAGSALSTFRADFERQDIDTSNAAGERRSLSFSRNAIGAFASLTLPLTDREKTLRVPIGELSVGGYVRAQRLSDRGSHVDYGSNLSWSPVDSIRFRVSRTRQTRVPTVNQLRAPVIVIPNIRLFDFSLGDTIDVSQTAGGNQRLRDEEVDYSEAGVAIKPFKKQNLSITLNYISQRTKDAIVAFPILNQDVLDTFPDRFVLDAAGRISVVDARPINVRELRESKVRLGFSWTKAIKGSSAGNNLIFSPATPDGVPPPGTLPPNTRIIDNPPGTPIPPEILNALSRIYFSVFYTWRLRNRVVLIDGGPDLDLLDGFALSGLGGNARHELSFSGGIFKRGIGARTSINWRSASAVEGSAQRSGLNENRLNFVYKPIVDFHFFINPEERIIGIVPGWIRGVQVTLGISNAFDLRPLVRDELGRTPLRFQSAYLDPLGRSVQLSVRKLF